MKVLVLMLVCFTMVFSKFNLNRLMDLLEAELSEEIDTRIPRAPRIPPRHQTPGKLRAGSSWDSYVDTLIGQSKGSCDKAGLFGLNGVQWTSKGLSAGIDMSSAEAQTIGLVLINGDYDYLKASGITVAGTQYKFMEGKDGMILGRSKNHGSITIEGSIKGFVVGHTAEKLTTVGLDAQGNTNWAVHYIADYLTSVGY